MALVTLLHRKGQYDEMDKTKYLPSEFGVVVGRDPTVPSGKSVYVCYGAGDVRRLVSIEDLEEMIERGDFTGKTGVGVKSADIDEKGHLIISLDDGSSVDAGYIDDALARIEEASTAAKAAGDSAAEAEESNKSAADWAKKAESHSHGKTGSRVGEDTDNAEYYYSKTKEVENKLIEIAGGDVATRPRIIEHNMKKSGWKGSGTPYLYEVEIPGLTATQLVYAHNAMGISQVQLEAFAAAQISANDQQEGKIILQAVNIPEMDLPIVIEVCSEPSKS